MRVDTPANVRRMGFRAEPAPDPRSSLMVVSIFRRGYAVAFRVLWARFVELMKPGTLWDGDLRVRMPHARVAVIRTPDEDEWF
jgi:hypothetical protein